MEDRAVTTGMDYVKEHSSVSMDRLANMRWPYLPNVGANGATHFQYLVVK